MIKLECPRCKKQFEAQDFANPEMLRYIRISSKYCTSCRVIVREEQEKRIKLEHDKMVQQIKARWIDSSGIPNRYITKKFDNFDKDGFKAIFGLVKNYADSFNANDYRGYPAMYLFSEDKTYGVGKTHLAASVSHEIIDNWNGDNWNGEYQPACPVLFISERDFLLRIRASFGYNYDKTETEDDIYQKLIHIPMLILDDVGKEETDKKDSDGMRSSAFVRRAYWQIIDGRYQENLPMFITSNYSINRIKSFLGEPSTERIMEMCGNRKNIIKLQGESKRNNILMESN